MIGINRRKFLRTMATAVVGSALLAKQCFVAEHPRRRFTANLNVGHIGVKASPLEAIKLAHQYGYETVAPRLSAMRK